MAATVPVELENGATIVIEDVAPLPVGATTDETVHIEHFGFGDKVQKFDHVNEVIEGIANELKTTLDRVTPHSATVEFGLEITGEPGYLTAALVKGSGTAHLTITLEWERNGATPAQN
jgi:Trypsin-co-occurring domain 1